MGGEGGTLTRPSTPPNFLMTLRRAFLTLPSSERSASTNIATPCGASAPSNPFTCRREAWNTKLCSEAAGEIGTSSDSRNFHVCRGKSSAMTSARGGGGEHCTSFWQKNICSSTIANRETTQPLHHLNTQPLCFHKYHSFSPEAMELSIGLYIQLPHEASASVRYCREISFVFAPRPWDFS